MTQIPGKQSLTSDRAVTGAFLLRIPENEDNDDTFSKRHVFIARTSRNSLQRYMYIMETISKNMSVSYTEHIPWWRHQMEAFSASLAIYAGN